MVRSRGTPPTNSDTLTQHAVPTARANQLLFGEGQSVGQLLSSHLDHRRRGPLSSEVHNPTNPLNHEAPAVTSQTINPQAGGTPEPTVGSIAEVMPTTPSARTALPTERDTSTPATTHPEPPEPVAANVGDTRQAPSATPGNGPDSGRGQHGVRGPTFLAGDLLVGGTPARAGASGPQSDHKWGPRSQRGYDSERKPKLGEDGWPL